MGHIEGWIKPKQPLAFAHFTWKLHINGNGCSTQLTEWNCMILNTEQAAVRDKAYRVYTGHTSPVYTPFVCLFVCLFVFTTQYLQICRFRCVGINSDITLYFVTGDIWNLCLYSKSFNFYSLALAISADQTICCHSHHCRPRPCTIGLRGTQLKQ